MKILLLISLMISLAFASIGQVTGIKGKATLVRGSQTTNLIVGHKLEKKDIIKTADKSKVQVIFDDKTIITIGKKSSLDIEEYLYDTSNPANSKLKLKFFKGAFKSISGKIGKVAPKRFKLKTKNATIGIRGTILAGNQTRVVCEKGAITVSANGVTQVVPAGMMTRTPVGAPPTPPVAFKAGSISLEDEAEQQEEKEKKEEKKKEEKKKGKSKAKEDKKSKKSDDKKEKKSAGKKDSKKSDSKKSTQSKSDDKKSSGQSSSSSDGGAKEDQQQESVATEEAAPAAEEQPAVALEIDDTEAVAIDVDGVDVADSVGDATDAAADSTGAAEEGVVNLSIANTKQDEVEVVAELEASGVVLGEGASLVDGEVVIDGEVVELSDDGELVIGGEEVEVVDGEILPADDADAIAAAEEEAARIAQEEADAIAAAEEEAARIAQEEADAIAAAEEEAAAAAEEEAAAGGGTTTTTTYSDITSITPLPDMMSVVKTESTETAYTTANYQYLEYGTWDSDTSSYIVGDVTPSEIVQNIIDNSASTQSYSATGEAIKSVNGVAQSGVLPATVGVSIDYTSTPTFTGTVDITDGTKDWSSTISGDVSKYGFSGISADGSIYEDGQYTSTTVIGEMQGKFYGPSADEVGGQFKLSDTGTSTTMNGVFGGKQQ